MLWTGLIGTMALSAPVVDDTVSTLRSMRTDCRVSEVTDGDTVKLRCADAGTLSARIVGYDTPELFSPTCAAEEEAALAAKTHLSGMLGTSGAFVDGGGLEVAFLGRDRYDRHLVDLRAGGERVATRMVRDGHGRRYLGGLRGGWCGGTGDV